MKKADQRVCCRANNQKGDSHTWGTIQTKDKVGNAFLRATSDKLGFDEAKQIKISSSLPASLSVNIFPERVPSTLKRDIEVIVTLIDSDGLPTLAQDDVKVEFFSDDASINNQIDRKIKEESIKGIIKKANSATDSRQDWIFQRKPDNINRCCNQRPRHCNRHFRNSKAN